MTSHDLPIEEVKKILASDKDGSCKEHDWRTIHGATHVWRQCSKCGLWEIES